MVFKLTYPPNTNLVAYSDADYRGCPSTRRSTSGYCVFLGDNLISWSSKCQCVVSRSNAEAEYRGVANAVAKTSWICNLLYELRCPITKANIVYWDNFSDVYTSANPVNHQWIEHIEIDIHFVRDQVARGQICVLHVSSSAQYADIFTKGLLSSVFYKFPIQFKHLYPRSNCGDVSVNVCIPCIAHYYILWIGPLELYLLVYILVLYGIFNQQSHLTY